MVNNACTWQEGITKNAVLPVVNALPTVYVKANKLKAILPKKVQVSVFSDVFSAGYWNEILILCLIVHYVDAP